MFRVGCRGGWSEKGGATSSNLRHPVRKVYYVSASGRYQVSASGGYHARDHVHLPEPFEHFEHSEHFELSDLFEHFEPFEHFEHFVRFGLCSVRPLFGSASVRFGFSL